MSRAFSPSFLAAAGGLLVAAGLGVILSFPTRTTSRSARENLNAPGALHARDRVAREAFFLSRRGLNFGLPAGAYGTAIVQMRRLEGRAAGSAELAPADAEQAAAPFAWSAVGPLPLTKEIPTFGGVAIGAALAGVTGRVTALAADPTVSGRMFVGTADGGVWMRANATAAFVPIFDLEPTLSIGALALDTTTSPNPTLYVGSGEGNGSADSYYGEGVFVSSDLGVTWVQLGASKFAYASIASIAVDTTQTPRTIYAAVTYGSSANRADASWVEGDFSQNGLWRSADGGESWIPYPAGTFGTCPYFANDPFPAESVAIDPASPAAVLVTILGVGLFRSSNSGFSFAQVSLPNLNGGVGRASVAAANGAAYAISGAADGIEFAGFYKSTDDGVTWAQTSVPSTTVAGTILDGRNSGNFSESYFDQTLAIDPADASGATVVFGGVGIYRSINGRSNWTPLAASGGTHSDQHAVAFDPASAHSFFLGNDGGLYRYDVGTLTWAALNTSISAAQTQSAGPHPTNSTVVIAGFQDNGTALYNAAQPPASSWTEMDGLDGGLALFDIVNPLFAYHTFATTSVGPWVACSSNGGATFNSAAASAALQTALATAGDAGAGYYPPLASDPAVAQRVLFGAHSVYVSNDGMATWAPQTTQDLTGGCNSGACALQDLEIAPSDDTKAYALSMETSATFRPTPFKIFTTDQANTQVNADQPNGAEWIDKTAQLPPNVFPDSTQATGIAVDPFDYSVAYLSLSGFTAATGIGHVFVTTDFGGSWTQADGNPTLQSPPPAGALPDVPVQRLLVDRNDPTANTVLAATDIGIFRTTDGGSTWAPFNLGVIPAVAVFDIEQNLSGVVFAATHGRGIFQLSGEGSPGAPSSTPAATGSATPTATPSASITATASPSSTAAATATTTRTATPTASATATSTATQTATLTATPTSTATASASATATTTATRTATPTASATATATATQSATPSATPTATRSATSTATVTPTPAAGSISFVAASALADYSAPVTTVSIGLPAGVEPGDTLLAQIAVWDGSGSDVPSPPSGWTGIRHDAVSNTSRISTWLYYKVAGANEPAGYGWNLSSQWAAGVMGAWRGAPLSPIDNASGATAAGASPLSDAAPSLTPSNGNELQVYFYGAQNGTSPTITLPKAITQRLDTVSAKEGFALGFGDLAAPSKGTASPTYAAIATLAGNDPVMTAQAILLVPASQSTATATVAAVLAVSPSAASFTAKRGEKSAAKDITAANQGKIAITLMNAHVTGNFQLLKVCRGALNPKTKCTYSVVFVPSVKGVSTGSLTIDNNGSNGPRTVSLSGTGR